MTKYNKAIITKSDNDGCEIQFHTTEKKEILNCDDYQFLEKQMFFLKKREIEVNELKNIVLVLSENKIKSLNDKIRNVSSRDKKLLSIYSYVLFLPKIPLEAIETKNVFVDKEQKNAINISTFYNQNPETIIPAEPTEKQLDVITKNSVFNLTSRKWQNLEEWNKEYNSYITNNMPFKDSKEIPVITQEQAKEIYYKLHEHNINYRTKERYENEYLNNLTDKELDEHYKTQLNLLEEELKTIQQYRKVIKHILYENQNSKGLATPNILPRVIEGKTKDMSLFDLYKKTKQNDIKDLLIILQSVAPNIYNKLTDCRKEELEKYILENSQEIITYIDGARLTILEDRAFCALRFKAVEAFEQGLVVSPSSKITSKLSDIYKLSGVHYGNGYDTKQRRAIKGALTNPDGNLIKRIHIEYAQKHKDGKAILSTNLIKYIDWNDEKDQVTHEIDSMFFVNVPDQPLKGHWPDDIEGRIRFITKSFKNGFQNENAYRLHRYIASSLRKKTKKQEKNQEYNVSTLLEHSGLISDFNNRKKTLALSKLQEYLDKMYEHETLIKNKPIRVNSKSDKYGKYELERL